MTFIIKRCKADGGSLVEAAAAVNSDHTRLSKSVYHYWDYLKSLILWAL
jgi:hypothetical protein